jgi:hypothetical protein
VSEAIQAEVVDPLNIPLPADIHFGIMLFNKGTSLRAFVQAMQRWRLRVQHQDILLAQTEVPDGATKLSIPQRHLRSAGMSAYHEGLACDPPDFFDGEEQREWAIGWIEALKAVWRVP